jgi:predicted PurR-regulated permease PerM
MRPEAARGSATDARRESADAPKVPSPGVEDAERSRDDAAESPRPSAKPGTQTGDAEGEPDDGGPIGQSPGAEETDRRSREAPVISSPLSIRSLSLTILAVLAVTFTLKEGKDFFIPLVLAVLVSYALDPIVTWIGRVVPRAIAAAVVLLLLVGGVAAGGYALRGQVATILEDVPAAATRFAESLRQDRRQGQGQSTLEQVQRAAGELEKAAAQATESPTPALTQRGVMRVQVEEPPIRVRDYIWWGWAGLMGLGAQLVAVAFLVYFMLVSGDLFKRKLVQITGPTLTNKKITVQILDEINRQVERFLLVQVFTSSLVGIFSWVVFWWIGLEQAAVWAIAAALFNSIPYFGPAIVTVGVTIVAYVQFETIGMALLAGGGASVITGLEGFLLKPWLTSRAASMNAVAIFIGLLLFTWLWGVWGTLLAVPMLMVAKAVCDRIEDLHPIAELLGE